MFLSKTPIKHFKNHDKFTHRLQKTTLKTKLNPKLKLNLSSNKKKNYELLKYKTSNINSSRDIIQL